ncbi:MAG TPA: hypothetical protein VMO88_14030, partial [Acidimicrobiales bacterium]|nr:hypothetical protein [Acidimicrobiales bacterium]
GSGSAAKGGGAPAASGAAVSPAGGSPPARLNASLASSSRRVSLQLMLLGTLLLVLTGTASVGAWYRQSGRAGVSSRQVSR